MIAKGDLGIVLDVEQWVVMFSKVQQKYKS